MKVYEDNFWKHHAPRFPAGCDPYNSHDEIARRDAAFVLEMEKAWKLCLSTPQPDFIAVSPICVRMMDAVMYEMQVPGRVFYPYESDAVDRW